MARILADKSAVGAINRPLRSFAYNKFIHPNIDASVAHVRVTLF